MKKVWSFLLVGLAALTLAGCISVETTVKLNRDGSGQIIEKIGIGMDMAGMMAGLQNEGGGTKPFTKEQFASEVKRLGEGVRFVSVDESQSGAMKYFTVVYAFDDINKISIDQNQGNAMPSGGGRDSDNKEEPVKFEFSAGDDYSTLKIRMPERETDFGESDSDDEDSSDEMETPPGMEQAGAEMMKMMLKGMHFAVKIEFNGEIVETNASNVDGATVTLLEMQFDAIMDDAEKLNALNAKKPKGIEEVKELLKDVEGLKFEFQEEVEVRFE